MRYDDFIDLEILSAQKPDNTHLFIETNSSGILYLVDSVDNTKLYKSIDKGDNWSLIETRTYDIVAFWHDRTNERLYAATGDRSAKVGSDDFEAFYVDLTDDSIIEVGAHNDANGYIGVFDILNPLPSFFFIITYQTNILDTLIFLLILFPFSS